VEKIMETLKKCVAHRNVVGMTPEVDFFKLTPLPSNYLYSGFTEIQIKTSSVQMFASVVSALLVELI
jgi:hypothetical protein